MGISFQEEKDYSEKRTGLMVKVRDLPEFSSGELWKEVRSEDD